MKSGAFECETWDEDGQFESENYLYYKTKKAAEAAVKDFKQMAENGEVPRDPDSQSVCFQEIDTLEVPTKPDELLKFVRNHLGSSGNPDLMSDWNWYED